MDYHPIANTFPLINGERFTELVETVKELGLLEPIVLYEDKILDGRNRYRACIAAEVEPRFVQYDGDDPFGFVVAMNLARRHLDEAQRAMCAARVANMKHGGDRKSKIENQEANWPLDQTEKKPEPQPKITLNKAAEQFNVSERSIKRARTVQEKGVPELAQAVDDGKVSLNAASAVSELPREEQVEVVARGEEEILRKAKEIREVKKPHVANNSGENEWYTPPKYTEAAKRVMGGIDLDPASNSVANGFVKADSFYTKEDDGLTKPWYGRVWLNPPYAQPLIAQFAEAVVSKFSSGEFEQAVVLVNNATDTKWLQSMMRVCSALCFPEGRIRFMNPKGDPVGAPLQGQVFLYFGGNVESFLDEFASFGVVMHR